MLGRDRSSSSSKLLALLNNVTEVFSLIMGRCSECRGRGSLQDGKCDCLGEKAEQVSHRRTVNASGISSMFLRGDNIIGVIVSLL